MAKAVTPVLFGLLLLAALSLLLPAAAQSAPSTPTDDKPAAKPAETQKAAQPRFIIVQLPFTHKGDFKPMAEEDIQKLLEKDIEAALTEVDVVVPDPQDPRVSGMDIFGDLTADDAAKIAKVYNARFVTWGTMAFSKEKKLMQMVEGVLIRYMITVTGAADVKVFDTASGTVALEQRMLQGNNGYTAAPEDSPQFLTLEKELANRCVEDLSRNLVHVIVKRFEKKKDKPAAPEE